MTDKSLMQLLAFNVLDSLYWDYSETQQFYLHNHSTNALQTITSTAAKTWFLTQPTNTSVGITFWGLTVQPGINTKGAQPVPAKPFTIGVSPIGGTDEIP